MEDNASIRMVIHAIALLYVPTVILSGCMVLSKFQSECLFQFSPAGETVKLYVVKENRRYCNRTECPHRRYGENCLSICLCSWEGTSECHSKTGACICKVGYAGRHCDDIMNICETPNPPCNRMETYCRQGIDSYTCACRDGFSMSDVDHCAPCPPFTHGDNCSSTCDCAVQNTLYCEAGICVCKIGWSGGKCDESNNECSTVVCPEGTRCVDKYRGYHCLCPTGFRLIENTCQNFSINAVTLESEPSVGELVDIFILYKLPSAYLIQHARLPDFVYTLQIEDPKKDLCQFSYKDTYKLITGSETFFSKLKIDRHSFNFYSHILVTFSEPTTTVVHMVPDSLEYSELILEFDVRHKSKAALDCLQGMTIPGTSSDLSRANTHKRQSYQILDVKFNPNGNCTEIPSVEWSYFSISKHYTDTSFKCMDWKTVSELDIDELTAAAKQRELSDHRSHQEIIPKGTLPLGHIMVCVLAYVENRRFRASTCGFINVVPSNIIVGYIVPNNHYSSWGDRWGITLTANFMEPDLFTRLKYEWSCTMYGSNGTTRSCNEDAFFKKANTKRRALNLGAGFVPHDSDVSLTVKAILNPSTSISKSVRVSGNRGSKTTNLPVQIMCERNCDDPIGTGRDVVFRSRFPIRVDYLIETRCSWFVDADRRPLVGGDLDKLLIVSSEWSGPSQQAFKATLRGTALRSGFSYTVYLICSVTTMEGLDRYMNRYPVTYTAKTQYWFETAKSPRGQGCSISPTQGEAVFTRFTVTCISYVDIPVKFPLRYRLFQYDHISGSNTPVETLVAYSSSSTIDNLTLSTSGGPGTAVVHLKMSVESVLGTKTEVNMSVQLTTLDQAHALKKAAGKIQTGSGGQADARLMKNVASIISVNSTASFVDKVATRRELLKNVEKLNSQSKNSIEQVSYVLSLSVEKANEIEPTGLEYGINTAHKLADALQKLSTEDASEINTVAIVQVNALSKLLDVSTTYGEDISTLNQTDELDKHNLTQKNIRQNALATESFVNIANVLLESISEVNAPIKVPTEFVDFTVAWNNVSKDTTFAVDSDNVNFSLPTKHSGVVENEIVGSEFETFKKNPYGWTADRVHGNMPVVKVRLNRQSTKEEPKPLVKEKFRFSKPADVYLNYHAVGEGGIYGVVIKVVNQSGFERIEKSECLFLTVKASTTEATILKVTSPNNLNILVKTKYTNDVSYFDKFNEEDMLEMPLSVPNTFQSPHGMMVRDSNLLIFPQLSKRQTKRNVAYYRLKISIKLNQIVDTASLTLMELTRNITLDEEDVPGEFFNVTIEATPHAVSCLHFDDVKNDYLSDQCAISMFSNLSTLHCRCIIAAAFTGSVLVMPRLINPLDVGLFLEVFNNPLVVSLVIAVWLIYIALISWSRSRDRNDERKRGVTVLEDNSPFYNYMYLVCVVTGWSGSSATSSDVFMYLKGSWNQSENHFLQDPVRRLFESGAENWFLLTTRADIGDLVSVVVWTDFSGASPSWYLKSVYVQNIQTHETWICPFNSWIGIHHGRDMLQAEVPAYKEQEYSSQWKFQVVMKSQNDIRNEHLWFGIVAKTPYNMFTRVRRLTTGLTLLQTLMLLNLMFFGIRDKDDPGQFIEVLGQTIHVTSFIIGIQTAFIISIVGFVISMLFTRIAPPPKHVLESDDTRTNLKDSLQRLAYMHNVKAADGKVELAGQPDNAVSQQARITNAAFTDTPITDAHRRSSVDIDTNMNANRRESNVDSPFKLHWKLSKNDFQDHSMKSSTDSSSGQSEYDDLDSSGASSDEVDSTDEAFGPDDGASPYVLAATDTLIKFTTELEPDDKPANNSYMLPWWFIYVTWTLFAIYNLFIAYYIMLYGLSLGYKKSVDWALAFFTGFLTNVFIFQPLKVIFMVFILVLIFKQGLKLNDQAPLKKLDDGIKLVHKKNRYNQKYKRMLPTGYCRPPLHTAEATLVIERHAIERAAREMLRDLFIYTIFMISVILVAYGHMDVRSQFLQTQYVKHIFLKTPVLNTNESKGYQYSKIMEDVITVETMWNYLKTVVAPEIIKHKKVTSNNYDFYLMGIARIRQVRSRNDSSVCPQLPISLGNLLPKEGCFHSALHFSEDTRSYDYAWDVPYNDSQGILDDSPYIYQPSDGGIFIGDHGFYSGGGYVIPLNQDDLGAMEDALTTFYSSDWINELTKCIFVEFTLYNAATDHFTNVIITFEFTQYGAIYPMASVKSTRLTDQNRDEKVWLQLSEGFMVICVVFYTIVQIQVLLAIGIKQYFQNLWNWLEVATILLASAVGACFFLRYYKFVETMEQFYKYGHSSFLNFQPVFQKQAYLHASLAMLGGVVIFKMLKVTAFNPSVMTAFRTFKNGQQSINGLLLITALFFFGVSLTAVLLFGSTLRSYRSIDVSLLTVSFFIMGESDYVSLVEARGYLGEIFFFAVTIATQIIIVNFFCVVLIEGFELTKYMTFRQDQETIKYMWNTVKLYSRFGPRNVRRIKVV